MSLNRSEDALLSYLRSHPDEERFWRARVQNLDRGGVAREELSVILERELRDYAAERINAAPVLRDTFGVGKVSLRNLAEYAIFSWTTPKPAKKR
ncbi:MAG: hypothetical protein ACREIA_18450 [Opitutaceae bacterium]